MVALIILILSFDLLAINEVESKSVITILPRIKRLPDVAPKRMKRKRARKISKSYRNELLIQEAENAALKERLDNLQNSRVRLDFTTSFNIPSGTTLLGTLLNSIVSSNLSSPVSVKIKANKFIDEDATLQCEGERAGRRIYVACDRLIIGDEEFSGLVTNLLNKDGSNGLKGDYWSGDERLIAGIAATSLASGIILATQDREPTPFGQQSSNSGKNTVISGLANTASEATRLMSDKLKVDSGVVTLNAGEQVLIYFKGGYRI